MRKAILPMVLAITSGSAAAEWVQMASAETHNAYADPATIHRKENRVKMWRVVDYKTATIPPGGKRFSHMSTKSREEYDCEEDRTRILSLSWHSKSMGRGNIVYSSSKPGQWEPINSESIQHTLFKLACRNP